MQIKLKIHSIVHNRLHMQGSQEEQLRALRTLAGMSKRKASAVPVTVVQQGFHALGAFKSLITLLSENMPHGQVCACFYNCGKHCIPEDWTC
jgi:hypothetical protein